MRSTLYPLATLALTLAASCQKETHYQAIDAKQLNAQTAYTYVENFTNLGPKPATTPAAKKAAEWIRNELIANNLDARLDTFDDQTPTGTSTFHNVIATLPGTTDDIIIIGSHYDTKSGLGKTFIGANDSASSTGLLIELARLFKTHYTQGPELRFLFFDGEECQIEYSSNDGFHGSQHYAQHLVDNTERKKVRAVIILDMIGDKDLQVTIPRNCHSKLISLAFQSAAKQGVREKFTLFKFNIADDHTAFIRRGMPAIDLIDFQYGTAPGSHDLWHTPNDTMEHISADSLDTVGRTVIEMINELARNSIDAQ